MTTVRIASADDEDGLMSLCCDLHHENALLPMNEDRVRRTLRRGLNKEDGVIGVIGDVGELQGAMVLVMGQLWYSDSWCIEELFSYVRPEFRCTKHAHDLIDFAKRTSAELGLPLMIGILSNARTEAKVRLYSRKFGPPAGAYFLYGATTGQINVRQ